MKQAFPQLKFTSMATLPIIALFSGLSNAKEASEELTLSQCVPLTQWQLEETKQKIAISELQDLLSSEDESTQLFASQLLMELTQGERIEIASAKIKE